jgi:hypothetical protein
MRLWHIFAKIFVIAKIFANIPIYFHKSFRKIMRKMRANVQKLQFFSLEILGKNI